MPQIMWACTHLNTLCGVHSHLSLFIFRSTLKTLCDQISSGLAEVYIQFVEDSEQTADPDKPFTPFSQTRALQVWFDVRFLLQIFPRKDDSGVGYSL